MHILIQSADYSLQLILSHLKVTPYSYCFSTSNQLARSACWCKHKWCPIMFLSFLKDGNTYRRIIKQVHTHKNTVIYYARASIRRKPSHRWLNLSLNPFVQNLVVALDSLCSRVQFLFHKLGIIPLQKLFIKKTPYLCKKSSKSGNLTRINYSLGDSDERLKYTKVKFLIPLLHSLLFIKP